jgi:hypothetical protein
MGFRIGCLSSQLVLTYSNVKAVYIADPDNRELITSIECISTRGIKSCPSFIIMAGALIKEKCFNNNLDPRIKFGMSDSGYSNDELGFEWIQHFNQYTRDSIRGEWRLLIMDGHSSHMTHEFITYCYDNKIHPFLLPAHSTHLLQPLDISIFQLMKHHHQQVLEEAVWFGGIDFNRTDFLACFQAISDQTFKTATIHSAWQKSGLSSFTPKVVLQKLIEYNPPEKTRPITPKNPITFSDCETPQSNEIDRYNKFIDLRIQTSILSGIPPTPSVARAIEKRKLKNYVEDVVKKVRIHYKLANQWPRIEAAELTVRWKNHVTKCAPFLYVIKHLSRVWEDGEGSQSQE